MVCVEKVCQGSLFYVCGFQSPTGHCSFLSFVLNLRKHPQKGQRDLGFRVCPSFWILSGHELQSDSLCLCVFLFTHLEGMLMSIMS
jgi:hypothetical protein